MVLKTLFKPRKQTHVGGFASIFQDIHVAKDWQISEFHIPNSTFFHRNKLSTALLLQLSTCRVEHFPLVSVHNSLLHPVNCFP